MNNTLVKSKDAEKSVLTRLYFECFISDRRFHTIVEARAASGYKVRPGTPLAKLVDESIEAAIVRYARRVVRLGWHRPTIETYEKLVEFYQLQPRLAVRSSDSIRLQQYSTPVPIAYLVSRLAGVTDSDLVYEPTAGNGSLLIDSNPAAVYANEIDPDRASELRDQGYVRVCTMDAAADNCRPIEAVDVVLINPPFGKMLKDSSYQIDSEATGKSILTNQADRAIVASALKAMKEKGRAILIMGGEKGDEESRSRSYNHLPTRQFWHWLYENFNVTQHFCIDGKLYQRQGAAFPIDVVLIEGRGKSLRQLPAADVPKMIKSFEALADYLPDAPAPPGFTFWFSGVDSEDELLMLREAGVHQFLVDPFQFSRLKSEFLETDELILDSGAYAQFKDPNLTLELDDYIEIAASWNFSYVVAPDVFGNAARTLTRWNTVKNLFLPWIPVWQYPQTGICTRSDVKQLEDYLEQSPIVGIGGLVEAMRSRNQFVLDDVLRLCVRFPRRLHIFALCNAHAINRYKDYALSGDSSTWLSAARRGEVLHVDANGHLTRSHARKIGVSDDRQVRCVTSARNLLNFCTKTVDTVAEVVPAPTAEEFSDPLQEFNRLRSEFERVKRQLQTKLESLSTNSEFLSSITYEDAQFYSTLLS